MKFPYRKKTADDDRAGRREPMSPGARTVVAVLGMWLGSLTLALSFLHGPNGMNREDVAALLKALAQLVELEEADLQRAPTYPGGPVDPIPHPDQR